MQVYTDSFNHRLISLAALDNSLYNYESLRREERWGHRDKRGGGRLISKGYIIIGQKPKGICVHRYTICVLLHYKL